MSNAAPPEALVDVSVDVTLIDEMLRLDPEQRLRQNDRMVQTIQELRDAFAVQREPDDADPGVVRSRR